MKGGNQWDQIEKKTKNLISQSTKTIYQFILHDIWWFNFQKFSQNFLNILYCKNNSILHSLSFYLKHDCHTHVKSGIGSKIKKDASSQICMTLNEVERRKSFFPYTIKSQMKIYRRRTIKMNVCCMKTRIPRTRKDVESFLLSASAIAILWSLLH